MSLDFDPDALRRVGQLIDTAATILNGDLGEDVAGCGADEVSTAIAGNLNARRRWLADHVRAGHSQGLSAAAGVDATATAYEIEDRDAAARYGQPSSAGGGTPTDNRGLMGSIAAPPSAPAPIAIPDISGRDGEELALALESGAGTGPVIAAATRCAALATAATQATGDLLAAQAQLAASGHSYAHDPMMARLSRAVAWAQGLAAHADTLSAGFSAAAVSYTSTLAAVGSSASWQGIKLAYKQALIENIATAGLAQPRVDALAASLATKQQASATAISGYQGIGTTASAPPGDLSDPGLDPHPGTAPDNTNSEPGNIKDDAKKPALDADKLTGGAGLQDMLAPIMGAAGPLMGSLAKANPLQMLGQAAQQLGQQAGNLAKNPHGSPLKPAALNTPHAGAGKGGAGKGGGGGAGGIKPGGAGIGGAVHPAAPGATPSTQPAAPTATPPARLGGAGISGAGGMGMMPMGARPGGDAQTAKVTSYEHPLPDVDSTGRPGVVGDTTKPAPLVDPDAHNAVRARIARRKADSAASSTDS